MVSKQQLTGSQPGAPDVYKTVREVVTMGKLGRHPNIVTLYEVIDDPVSDWLYLGPPALPPVSAVGAADDTPTVLEYLPHGALDVVLDSRKAGQMSEDEIRSIMLDVVEGVNYSTLQRLITTPCAPDSPMSSSFAPDRAPRPEAR